MISSFSPVSLSQITLPGSAQGVDVSGELGGVSAGVVAAGGGGCGVGECGVGGGAGGEAGNEPAIDEEDQLVHRSAPEETLGHFGIGDEFGGAGEHGGHLVACGTPAEVARVPESLTGQYLAGKLRIGV